MSFKIILSNLKPKKLILPPIHNNIQSSGVQPVCNYKFFNMDHQGGVPHYSFGKVFVTTYLFLLEVGGMGFMVNQESTMVVTLKNFTMNLLIEGFENQRVWKSD